MKFQLRPILSEMKAFYQQPISPKRFKEYLSKLQGGTKGDLVLPISGFNPMAKEHVIEKIEELEEIEAEIIIEQVINEFNSNIEELSAPKIEVVLNLADDFKGGWTNHDTTDFESKFKINALVTRNFCAPYFWTSEIFTEELTELRTKEYLNRTWYWLNHAKPKTLKDHLEQEIFVFKNTLDDNYSDDKSQFEFIEHYYLEHQESEAYDLIFNFLYGDGASENLGYKKHGIKDKTGFEYAKYLATKRKTNA